MSVGPLRLVFSFIFIQAACLLHTAKPYRGVNFLYQCFLSAAYLDATKLFQSWISEVLQPGATTRITLARYLQLHDWDPVCDHAPQIKIIVKEY